MSGTEANQFMGAHPPSYDGARETWQAIDGDDDMLTAMARELVENRGIGESADSVWKRLCPAHALPAPEDSREAAIVPAEFETPEPLPPITEPIPNASLLEAVNLPDAFRKKLRTIVALLKCSSC